MTWTRRRFLAGGGIVGAVGVVGCLGGDDGGPSEYDCDMSEPDSEPGAYRPTLGDPDSDVVVQTFEDFTCGGCAAFKANEFPTIRAEYVDSGEVRYEHWDFPIPVDEEWSVPVASAARGVGARDGDEAFFAFASAIYERFGEYSLDAIGAAAEEAGSDPCAAIADAHHETYEGALEADRNEGVSRGLQATPTVYVNGEAVGESNATAVGDAIAAAKQ